MITPHNQINSYVVSYQSLWLHELRSQTSYGALKITKKVSNLPFGLVVALDRENTKLKLYVKCPEEKAYGSYKKVTFPSNCSEKIAFCELLKEQRANEKAKSYIQNEGNAYKTLEGCTHVVKGRPIRYRRWNPANRAAKSEIREALILEYMSLGSIADCREKGINFSNKEFKKIAIDTAQGVLELHEKNTAHNDLKPDNILVCPDAHQLVIAKLADLQYVSSQKIRHTNNGSPLYVSPEKLLKLKIGSQLQDDIWSLGITFFELLRGRRPSAFADAADFRVLTEIMRAPAKIRGGMPEGITFKRLIYDMTDPDPKHRPTIQKVIERLQVLPESEFIFPSCKIDAADLRLTKSFPN